MAVSLVTLCLALKLPEPMPEYRFHPVRKWRFDFAWPEQKLALEVQGAVFVQGRHTRGAGLRQEYEKLNAAAVSGWRVLFVLPEQMTNGTAIQIVQAALQ